MLRLGTPKVGAVFMILIGVVLLRGILRRSSGRFLL